MNISDPDAVKNIGSPSEARPEEVIMKTCLSLKPEESCLIVTDKNLMHIADIIRAEAEKISDTILLEIPPGKINGEEPPARCAEEMLKHDVIILVTTKSLSWTKARQEATDNGSRIASMPGINLDIFNRAITVDYDDMKDMTNRIADILDSSDMVRVTSKLGTDIRIDISGRKAHGRDAGYFTEKGKWGNLPEGEAFVCPVEGKTNGIYIVDASQAGVGKLDEPIKIEVVDGFATRISGDKKAEDFLQMLESIGDRNAFNVAELGIGTNRKARICGLVLEDEKVYGTCHIALGKNKGFGGNIDVPVHVDGIITRPTIYADDRIIMKDGELLV